MLKEKKKRSDTHRNKDNNDDNDNVSSFRLRITRRSKRRLNPYSQRRYVELFDETRKIR